MDNAAKRSRARVKQDGRESAARLDSEVRNVAAKIGHHGPVNLIEVIRQRCKARLDPDHARELCILAGWKP
jgi:LytS/YehU family sensor histidine kinase